MQLVAAAMPLPQCPLTIKEVRMAVTQRLQRPGLELNSDSMKTDSKPIVVDRTANSRKHWDQCLRNGKSLIDISIRNDDDVLAGLTLNLLATLSGLAIVFGKVATVLEQEGRLKVEGRNSVTLHLGLSRQGLTKRLGGLGCSVQVLQGIISGRKSFSLNQLVLSNDVLESLVKQIDARLKQGSKVKPWPKFLKSKSDPAILKLQKFQRHTPKPIAVTKPR